MDIIDMAQQREMDEREQRIASARRRPLAPSCLFCKECHAPIPEERRRTVPGVSLCVACKAISEQKSRHYRKGL